ncbi:MAG TPA: hypothetical protein VGD37_36335 [Kofleriaceae bacterium]
MSSALDRGELASYMARGHAARCASCQAFSRALVGLDSRLSREAHTAAAPGPVARRARARWLVAAPLAAGAAAVIAVAISAGGKPPPSPAAPLALQTAPAVAQVRVLADRISQAVANTPLDRELDALIHDGKRGLEAVLATGGLGESP